MPTTSTTTPSPRLCRVWARWPGFGLQGLQLQPRAGVGQRDPVPDGQLGNDRAGHLDDRHPVEERAQLTGQAAPQVRWQRPGRRRTEKAVSATRRLSRSARAARASPGSATTTSPGHIRTTGPSSTSSLWSCRSRAHIARLLAMPRTSHAVVRGPARQVGYLGHQVDARNARDVRRARSRLIALRMP